MQDLQQTKISKHRLEMLFDGVFAIAMTILILEVKPPEISAHMTPSLMLEEIRHILPTIYSFIGSFILLAILWSGHNEQYRHFSKITTPIFCMQIVQMMAASSYPFAAALLGRFPTNQISYIIVVSIACLYSWASLLAWVIATKTKVLEIEPAPGTYKSIHRRNWVGSLTGVIVLVYFVASL